MTCRCGAPDCREPDLRQTLLGIGVMLAYPAAMVAVILLIEWIGGLIRAL